MLCARDKLSCPLSGSFSDPSLCLTHGQHGVVEDRQSPGTGQAEPWHSCPRGTVALVALEKLQQCPRAGQDTASSSKPHRAALGCTRVPWPQPLPAEWGPGTHQLTATGGGHVVLHSVPPQDLSAMPAPCKAQVQAAVPAAGSADPAQSPRSSEGQMPQALSGDGLDVLPWTLCNPGLSWSCPGAPGGDGRGCSCRRATAWPEVQTALPGGEQAAPPPEHE